MQEPRAHAVGEPEEADHEPDLGDLQRERLRR